MENYTEEQMLKIRQEGFQSGQLHVKMSDESKTMFKIMDEKIDKLGGKIDGLCDKIHSLELTVSKMPQCIMREADERYAEKETQFIVKGIQSWLVRTGVTIILLMGGIIGILIYAISQFK